MKILAIAQTESTLNLRKQLFIQTIQPDWTFFHVDDNPAKGIDNRRKRIAENHKYLVEAVETIKPDLVWQLEGDCELPRDCLERLLEDYELLSIAQPNSKPFGYVSGIQVGRHGLYCLGAWHVDMDRQGFHSLNYKSVGYQLVDATGFYCLLAPTEVWLQGRAHWSGQPWGPDVNWGLSLKKYNIYCDMDLQIGHYVKRGVIKPSHISTCNADFYKDDRGQWKYKTSD